MSADDKSYTTERVLPPRHHVPALERRYPPGCPDPDWCSGNGVCYWRCAYDDDVPQEAE